MCLCACFSLCMTSSGLDTQATSPHEGQWVVGMCVNLGWSRGIVGKQQRWPHPTPRHPGLGTLNCSQKRRFGFLNPALLADSDWTHCSYSDAAGVFDPTHTDAHRRTPSQWNDSFYGVLHVCLLLGANQTLQFVNSIDSRLI